MLRQLIEAARSEKYEHLDSMQTLINSCPELVNGELHRDDLHFGPPTALIAAIEQLKFRSVELLLSNGADPNLETRSGQTAGLALLNALQVYDKPVCYGKDILESLVEYGMCCNLPSATWILRQLAPWSFTRFDGPAPSFSFALMEMAHVDMPVTDEPRVLSDHLKYFYRFCDVLPAASVRGLSRANAKYVEILLTLRPKLCTQVASLVLQYYATVTEESIKWHPLLKLLLDNPGDLRWMNSRRQLVEAANHLNDRDEDRHVRFGVKCKELLKPDFKELSDSFVFIASSSVCACVCLYFACLCFGPGILLQLFLLPWIRCRIRTSSREGSAHFPACRSPSCQGPS